MRGRARRSESTNRFRSDYSVVVRLVVKQLFGQGSRAPAMSVVKPECVHMQFARRTVGDVGKDNMREENGIKSLLLDDSFTVMDVPQPGCTDTLIS